MIKIKAEYKSCIDRIVSCYSAKPTLTKDVYVNSSYDKEEIIILFQNCVDFYLYEGEIHFKIPTTDEEKNKELEANKNHTIKNINILKKRCAKNEEVKTQIIDYLKHTGLRWIVEEIES